MISCTEFIPLYSEFFKYLDQRGGYDQVQAFWDHLSDTSLGNPTNPRSMVACIEARIKAGDPHPGFHGAGDYWSPVTEEEACDTYSVIDEAHPYHYSEMRYCPSRGMLNALEHITPYPHYCDHCKTMYSRVLEKYGVMYDRDQSEVHLARCSSVLYEKGNPPPADMKEPKEGRIANRCVREGKKYLHRDFHLSGDNALAYCAATFGEAAVVEFLTAFTKAYFAPQIRDFSERGLTAVKEWLEKIYQVEEAGELLTTELTDNQLTVTVAHCPAIAYMHSLGQKPSPYYIEETRTVYAVAAAESGLGFSLDYYNEDGGARFTFTK